MKSEQTVQSNILDLSQCVRGITQTSKDKFIDSAIIYGAMGNEKITDSVSNQNPKA